MPGKKVNPPLAKEAQRLSSFFPAVQTPLVPVAYYDTSDEEAGTESEDDDYDEMGIVSPVPSVGGPGVAAGVVDGVGVNPAPGADEPNFPKPVVHSHDRSRQVHKKKPSSGRRHRGKGTPSNQVLTPESVVFALSCEHLKVSAGNVFCIPCGKVLCGGVVLKTATVKSHIRTSQKHKRNVTKWMESKVRSSIVSKWAIPGPGEAGQSVSSEIHDRRYRVVENHLRKGLPMNLFDDEGYRDSVQGNGPPLAGRRTMSDYIPKVLQAEKERLREWVADLVKRGYRVSGEYDGSRM